jgi:hypothetical protein
MNDKQVLNVAIDKYLNEYHNELKSWIENTDNIPDDYKDYILCKLIDCKLNVRKNILTDLEMI